ncbi:hypothetical protein BC477_18365 [Clavibacter michiganensis subsp. michiganensis]|uniref:Uncharacterized protein n=1 Tax=Clavibacter michiganensis subsp. michiganensis TaxID=33013 RepID=A0A251XGW8_CLAMM|nr:hypothetical protein BC477_18365 [Clavibacter michiganensis subsp. michiganensis]OUE01447.1 hypothetical protein CMMCAS07_14150 [Clavibacter michiganensis subsp. michiganensis]
MAARSTVRSRPENAASSEWSTSLSVSLRLRASRLPVPEGRRPSETPDPDMPSATARTVPSPPAAMTMSTSCDRASCAAPLPGSSSLVSNQRVSCHPAVPAACARPSS